MTSLNVITHRDTLAQLNKQISQKSQRIDQLKIDYNQRRAQLNRCKSEFEEFTREPFDLVQSAGNIYRQRPSELQELQRKSELTKSLEQAQKNFDRVAPEFEQLQAELIPLRKEVEALEAQQPTANNQEYDAAINSVKASREELEKIRTALNGLESKDIQQLQDNEARAQAELDARAADFALGLAKPEELAKAKQSLQDAAEAHASALGANVDLETFKRGLSAKLAQAEQTHTETLNNAKTVILAHRTELDKKAQAAIAKKLNEINRLADTLRQSDLIRNQLDAATMYFYDKVSVKGFGQDEGTTIELKIGETAPDDAIMELFS